MNPYKYVCDLPVRKTTTAQNSIERALISLLDTNELYELSVKEICQIANVARSTFYAYYNGIDDCVTEIENRFIKDVIEINNSLKCIGKISNIDLSFFENTVLYIKDNKKLLYLFMIKRYNNRFVYKWKDAIKYHLYQRMPEGLGDNNKELTLEIMASQAIGGVKMKGIKIRVLHTGSVCVAPALPFGGDSVNPLKLSPVMVRKSERLWLPVSSYLIEHPKGKILVDCGWHRDMSPNGEFDKSAQIRTLGSKALYLVNQGKVEKGQTVDEQLLKLGITPADLDYVILSHLDCDHANGVSQVKEAKHILVSKDELIGSNKKGRKNRIRYQSKWWEECKLESFDWNDTEGPFGKAYDLFGDGSVKLISIPGHSEGLCAVKVKNDEGKYVLLYSDGGYATKSWKEMIASGVSTNKEQQLKSLEWIRAESMNENCLESIANHDPDVIPHNICL